MKSGNTSIIIIGLLALTIGIAIKLFVGRRCFYRRNQTVLRGFKNYRSAIGITFLERIPSLIGSLVIAIGVIFLFVATLVG